MAEGVALKFDDQLQRLIVKLACADFEASNFLEGADAFCHCLLNNAASAAPRLCRGAVGGLTWNSRWTSSFFCMRSDQVKTKEKVPDRQQKLAVSSPA